MNTPQRRTHKSMSGMDLLEKVGNLFNRAKTKVKTIVDERIDAQKNFRNRSNNKKYYSSWTDFK